MSLANGRRKSVRARFESKRVRCGQRGEGYAERRYKQRGRSGQEEVQPGGNAQQFPEGGCKKAAPKKRQVVPTTRAYDRLRVTGPMTLAAPSELSWAPPSNISLLLTITMTRFAILAIFLAALAQAATVVPQEQEALDASSQLGDKWSWKDCGMFQAPFNAVLRITTLNAFHRFKQPFSSRNLYRHLTGSSQSRRRPDCHRQRYCR